MKIICVDNYDREYYDDVLIAENVHDYYGEIIVNLLNNREHGDSDDFFKLVPDEYKLFKFEP
jgi:hypothetical protein